VISETLKAAILGLIQGLTEFLPISSSAHLLALERVLAFEQEGVAFDVAVHLATLLAVVLYFRRDLIHLLTGSSFWPMLLKITVATIPVGLIGYFLASVRENISPWVAVAGWTFSATYLLLTRDRAGTMPYTEISLGRAFGVGLAQSLSIFPGVSRSGSTIAAGLWLGLRREDAARFSFLLAIPAMLGAGLLKGLELAAEPEIPAAFWGLCGTGMVIALVTGLLAIHILLRVVRSNLFHRFGWYNLAAAAAFAAYLALGH
jgi:undecaprenyl-diphosphatase